MKNITSLLQYDEIMFFFIYENVKCDIIVSCKGGT